MFSETLVLVVKPPHVVRSLPRYPTGYAETYGQRCFRGDTTSGCAMERCNFIWPFEEASSSSSQCNLTTLQIDAARSMPIFFGLPHLEVAGLPVGGFRSTPEGGCPRELVRCGRCRCQARRACNVHVLRSALLLAGEVRAMSI